MVRTIGTNRSGFRSDHQRSEDRSDLEVLFKTLELAFPLGDVRMDRIDIAAENRYGNTPGIKCFLDPKSELFVEGAGGRKGFGDGKLYRQVFTKCPNGGSERLGGCKGTQIVGANSKSHHTGSIKGFGKGVKEGEDGDDTSNDVG